MKLCNKIWNKIKGFVDKVYTDKKTGNLFLASVIALGASGLIFCLAWFVMLCVDGIPLWALIFDSAIIIFCAWAIFYGIVPMAREAFKLINKDKENGRKEEIHRSTD